MTEYYKKVLLKWQVSKKWKLGIKLRQMHYAKKSVLMAYVRMYGCHENIKTYKKKMIVKFNYIF